MSDQITHNQPEKQIDPAGDKIRVNEIFGPTVQGEGALIGQATVFVRTGGCDFRCSWCDTLHAVDSAYRHEWPAKSVGEIWAKIEELSKNTPLTVSLSGGNPAIQPLGGLIKVGRAKGYKFALETQGSISRDWFSMLDILTLSPKPPSSGMAFDLGRLKTAIAAAGLETEIALKIVIFDEADYQFARQVMGEITKDHPAIKCYIQPGNHTPPPPDESDAEIDIGGILNRYEWLVERAFADQWYDVTILPQLHVLVWGNKRGV